MEMKWIWIVVAIYVVVIAFERIALKWMEVHCK